MDTTLQNLLSLSEEEFHRLFERATEARLARQVLLWHLALQAANEGLGSC